MNKESYTAIADADFRLMQCSSLRGGRRPLVAYHEAGHCLARLYFGHWFDRAIVRSAEECRAGPLIDDRGREVTCEGIVMGYDISSPFVTPESLRHREGALQHQAIAAEISLIEALAGIVAEARYRKVSRIGVILRGGGYDWEQASAVSKRWFGAEYEAALALAEERTAALIQSPHGWRAVERIAARLLGDGVMDCSAAKTIFAQTYGRPMPEFGFWTERWPPTPAMLREPPCRTRGSHAL